MLTSCLDYPLDVPSILKKTKSLKRELSMQNGLVKKRIAILGGSTTAAIKDILELFLLKQKIQPSFYESDYDRYYEDLMFENPALREFKPEVIWIHTTVVNIANLPCVGDSDETVAHKFAGELDRFKSLWEAARRRFGCQVIQNNFDLPPYRPLGNLDFSKCSGRTNFVHRLNMEFAKHAESSDGFYINDINYVSAQLGLRKWHDPRFWYSYKYAVSYEAIPALAQNLASIVGAIYGSSKKCLVLDLDNTLWGGVIGDDGLANLQIGRETAAAEAFTALQEYVKELSNRGVVLAVCSKNDEVNAREGFGHPDSVLKLEDFASFQANWDMKSSNIQKIAVELNLSADSFVFLDDNPVERDLVRSHVSSVAVPDIGNDVASYIDHLDSGHYFEPAALSQDDLARGRFYQDNSQRVQLAQEFADYDEFLRSLKMAAEILPFEKIYLDRIAQLTNKTNQFNLTTRRYSLAEIEELSSNPQSLCLYGKLTDRFGDNGLISVFIGNRIEHELMNIELWLMSCRVLKRGMEHALLDTVVKHCRRLGVRKLRGTYLRTEKNGMVADLFEQFAFTRISATAAGDSVWEYVIPDKYDNRNQFITVIDGI